MGDLTLHFSRWEFECHGENCCGHVGPVSERLLAALELLHDKVRSELQDENAKIHVDSGFRCRKHNDEVKGDSSSYHMTGEAADIRVDYLSSLKLARLAKSVGDFASGGIGVYPNFVHVDVRRGGMSRW